MQADVLRAMVGAVHDFRGTYNVTDYRWFNLRDGDTSSPQPFQHFGLFDSAYKEKPAFAVYDRLVDRLHRRPPGQHAPPQQRLKLALRTAGRKCTGARCPRSPWRAWPGAIARSVRRPLPAGRRATTIRWTDRAPFSRWSTAAVDAGLRLSNSAAA